MPGANSVVADPISDPVANPGDPGADAISDPGANAGDPAADPVSDPGADPGDPGASAAYPIHQRAMLEGTVRRKSGHWLHSGRH